MTKIVESWEDHNGNCYAILQYDKATQKKYRVKEYEAVWMNDMSENQPELNSFAGSVGYWIADFETKEEAQDYLLKGISEYDNNPDIWFEPLKVEHRGRS